MNKLSKISYNKMFVVLPMLLLFCTCVSAEPMPNLQQVPISKVITELNKKWPDNRTINLVFHGHSVPSGYYIAPHVNTFESYPMLTLKLIKEHYPNAVVNSIVTAIGGENSESGAARFDSQVLNHKPDVLFIDYAINDRNIGLMRAYAAWEKMITAAKSKGVIVVLLTPTPVLNDKGALSEHAQQIRELAEKHDVLLIDSSEFFDKEKSNGVDLKTYMSQNNHPNARGHGKVANLIIKLFL